jgi:hypothetical protein
MKTCPSGLSIDRTTPVRPTSSATSVPSGPACARSTVVITSTKNTSALSVADATSHHGELQRRRGVEPP